jgi:phosphoglycerol transferase MdoB-like AlkP superfamily enzyme
VVERWNVQHGEEGFRGATTHGELRLLCGLDARYSNVDAGWANRCLPGQLRAQGFQAIGYHGFQLVMFNRERWWQFLGLKPYNFDYQHASAGARDCHNVFRGICDVEVLRSAIANVQEDRRFSYVVTLDTHLPLPVAAGAVTAEVRAICDSESLPDRACELVNLLGRVLQSLGTQLAAGAGTPYVAVVGDHAPPFLERESRAAFKKDMVPFLLLEPKR